jgi:PAS domain-containing protein
MARAGDRACTPQAGGWRVIFIAQAPASGEIPGDGAVYFYKIAALREPACAAAAPTTTRTRDANFRMSYVTVAWSLVASCALLLGLMYGLVWLADRKARASLAFAAFSLGMVGVVIVELGMMRASAVVEWETWVRWLQVPGSLVLVGLALFVRLQFRAGRLWLLWTFIAMRCVILLVTFTTAGSFNFERVDSIARISFLGDEVTTVGSAVASRWQWLGSASFLLLMAYLVDAAITLWRGGTGEARRMAINIGSASFLFILSTFVYVQLAVWSNMHLPALISLPFLFLLAAMAYEMSRETIRASRLARELRESDGRLQYAATAAGLGLWSWDSLGNRVWATRRAQLLLGLEGE